MIIGFISAAFLGNWYGSHVRGDEAIARWLVGANVTLQGTVKEDISYSERGDSRVQLSDLEVDKTPLKGVMWISTTSKREMLRGDTLVVRGLVDEGFGTFVGMMKKADVQEVIRPVPGDIGRVVRDGFAEAVRKGVDEPQASLGIGYLTGQKSALPADLAEALQIAGLTHIVVASGYNLTILVRLSRRLFVKVSKYAAVTSSSLMITGFVAVTGLSPSMTRAGIVSGLSLLTWSYGRSCHPFVLLALVAAVTVAWQPSFVWGDMGWQLSFAAFFGVMVVAPLLQAYFFGKTPPGTIRQVLGETVAAHIVTLPITVSAFGVISHVAIIANILIVPLVPLAMLLAFITGMTGLILPDAAGIVGYPASWLLSYMTETSMFLAGLPWAQMSWSPAWWFWLGYLTILGLACWWMWRVTKLELRDANPVI
jgi:competence protein ComEC